MKTNRCPVCKGKEVEIIIKEYVSNKRDKETNNQIIVPNVKVFKCKNDECAHTWLPHQEEAKIKTYIKNRSRHCLTPGQIMEIRTSLPFRTKTELASFLNLNSKAFVKWENGYTVQNDAYDLLLRLVAYNKDNLEFIKYLHKNNFKYNECDYQFVCESKKVKWNFAEAVYKKNKDTKLVLLDYISKKQKEDYAKPTKTEEEYYQNDYDAKAA
ncbi:MAG: hypothetical protein JXA66_00795 [Oligoflexia bacterium]|nr:hypothetical protein [Oligoflexia bacterium]